VSIDAADALMGIFGFKRVPEKTCKACKEKFQPLKPLQTVCDWKCAQTLAEQKKAKELAKKAIAERKETKEKLLNLEKLSYFEKKTEKAVNRYVRLRDLAAGYGCISCDKPNNWQGQWHASHFKSVGANSFLRYHMWNIHLGCSQCNRQLSGNIGEYTERLPARIGQEKFDYLKTAPRTRKYPREYLERLEKLANKRAKRYERKLKDV